MLFSLKSKKPYAIDVDQPDSVQDSESSQTQTTLESVNSTVSTGTAAGAAKCSISSKPREVDWEDENFVVLHVKPVFIREPSGHSRALQNSTAGQQMSQLIPVWQPSTGLPGSQKTAATAKSASNTIQRTVQPSTWQHTSSSGSQKTAASGNSASNTIQKTVQPALQATSAAFGNNSVTMAAAALVGVVAFLTALLWQQPALLASLLLVVNVGTVLGFVWWSSIKPFQAPSLSVHDLKQHRSGSLSFLMPKDHHAGATVQPVYRLQLQLVGAHFVRDVVGHLQLQLEAFQEAMGAVAEGFEQQSMETTNAQQQQQKPSSALAPMDRQASVFVLQKKLPGLVSDPEPVWLTEDVRARILNSKYVCCLDDETTPSLHVTYAASVHAATMGVLHVSTQLQCCPLCPF